MILQESKRKNKLGGPSAFISSDGYKVTGSTWTPEQTAAFNAPVYNTESRRVANPGPLPQSFSALPSSSFDSGSNGDALFSEALDATNKMPVWDHAFSGKEGQARHHTLMVKKARMLADLYSGRAQGKLNQYGSNNRAGLASQTSLANNAANNDRALVVNSADNIAAANRSNQQTAAKMSLEKLNNEAKAGNIALRQRLVGENQQKYLQGLGNNATQANLEKLANDYITKGGNPSDVQALYPDSAMGFGGLGVLSQPTQYSLIKPEYDKDGNLLDPGGSFDPNSGQINRFGNLSLEELQALKNKLNKGYALDQ